MSSSQGARLLASWQRLEGRPFGRWLFSRLLGRQVPYTGTIRPRVVELRPGYARVEMDDRPIVRNHLQSIHAVALVNIGEVASGLAMMTGLPPTLRSIVTGISIEYVKKARGRLTAESTVVLPEAITEAQDFDLASVVRDGDGDVVARATVRWRIGPRPAPDRAAADTQVDAATAARA
jgi:acyl-coenzyme A thioesterase PaaI-like protein